MSESYLQRFIKNEVSAEGWKDFISDLRENHPGTSVLEPMGLLKDELEELEKGKRNLEFFAFKRKSNSRIIVKLWPGCYVKYAMQYDNAEPHFEYGWIDAVEGRIGFARIQCDDTYMGARAVSVRTSDIMEILPYKERPLVYYKTMICGDCNKCQRQTNDFPPNCPQFDFFNAIMNKQRGDIEFLKFYFEVVKKRNESNRKTENPEG